MTKEELITKLTDRQGDTDPEIAHEAADRLLLDFIDDPKVTEAYLAITRWYA